jgi:hypothetical protein
MKSWNLNRFIKLNGVVATASIWGVSHQAVSAAARTDRNIQVVLVCGYYEVRESKRLGRVKESKINLEDKK